MAKIRQITQYEANDGSLFNTEAECNAHDFKLENGAKIELYTENFLNATHAIDRSRSIQGNAISAFLAFHLSRVAEGIVDEVVERTVFDTPKEPKADAAAETAAETAADAVEPQAEGEEVQF